MIIKKLTEKFLIMHTDESIFYIYLKKISLCIILPFMLFFLFFMYNYCTNLKKENVNYILNDFYTIEQNTNYCFETASNTYNSFLQNNDIKHFLYLDTILSNDYANISSIKNVQSWISTILFNSKDSINNIYIYSFINDYIISSYSGEYSENYSNTAWLRHFLSTDENSFIIPGNDDKTIDICYQIRIDGVQRGLVIFEINTSAFTQNVDNKDYYLLVTESQGTQLFENKNKPEYLKNILKTTQKTNNSNIETKIYFNHATFSIPFLNGNIFLSSKLNYINKNLKIILLLIFFCLILFITIPILISWYISLNLYTSVKNVVSSIYKIQKSENITTSNIDEFAFITNSIMNMKIKNDDLEKELTQKMSEYKKLQISALQMQLNPHFLFNTLNTVSMISMNKLGWDNPATAIVNKLSDLLTVALNTHEIVVTIEEEIDYCKKYIEIEKIKDDNFDVVWNIDENLLKYKTSKLILQPIVENAFTHGIKYLKNKKRGQLIFDLYASKNNKDIFFCVSNNGENIPLDNLKKIQKDLSANKIPSHKHVGLFNVNSRLKLMYGDEYGCMISSDEKLTTVTLSFRMYL